MFKGTVIKKFAILILLLVLFLTISDFLWAEAKYNPPPIIFVHGYNNDPRKVSKDKLWYQARYNFKNFFEYYPNWPFNTPVEFKYLNGTWHWDWKNSQEWEYYMSVFDYRAKSNGDISDIVGDLKNHVDRIINKLRAIGQEEKVVIVTHSMGGLVTRYFLTKYPSYQDKIERVVFVDTPHLGSPLATGVILTDRLIPELEEIQVEHHKWTGIDRNLDVNWQLAVYSDRDRQIADTLNWYKFLTNLEFPTSIKDMLAGSGIRYDPTKPHNQGQGVAVGELVVAADVKATKTFVSSTYSASAKTMVSTAPLIANSSYGQSETFLHNNILVMPTDFKIIEGTGSLGGWFIGLSGGALFKSVGSYEGLPEGNTFDDLDNGDGIVTPLSQTAGGEADYIVNRWHGSAPDAWQTILQALDDPPVVESVRILKNPSDLNASDYIIVKVKDYLLADIEIVELTDADLTGFREPVTGKNKPYIGYPKKGFLIERDVPIPGYGTIHLMPGEFHAELTEKIDYGAIYNIRIKNPAGKKAACQVALPVKQDDGVWRHVSNEFPGGCYPPWYSGGDAYFEQFRNDAIGVFNTENSYYYPDVPNTGNQPDFHTSPIGGHAYGFLATAIWGNEPHYYMWDIYADSDIAPLLEFNLNITKPITSARLTGNFQFEHYRQKSLVQQGKEDIIIEEKTDEDADMAFIISFDKDNTSLILNTKLHNNGDAVDIPIGPQCLNPNGTNAWTLSTDSTDDFLNNNSLITNCFPNYSINKPPVSNSCGPFIWSHIIYRQKAYIDDPLLIVTLEEENQN